MLDQEVSVGDVNSLRASIWRFDPFTHCQGVLALLARLGHVA